MTEPLWVLDTDDLLPLDLGGKGIYVPQFRVIHTITVNLSQGQWKSQS